MTKHLINKSSGFYILLSTILFLLCFLIYFNYSFSIRKVEVDFLDSGNESSDILIKENKEIEDYLNFEISKNTATAIDYILLDEYMLTKLVRDEFQIVNRIDFDKKVYFNSLADFGFSLFAVVVKNDEYFVGCIEESSRDSFLLWSMLGNSEGEFFKEVSQDLCNKTTTTKLKFFLNPLSLHDKLTGKKVNEADSLSGMRVYTANDFMVLKEIILYLQKNKFQIDNVYVNQIKLVDINMKDYKIVINLEKPSSDTIADFEAISRAGKLQEYINNDKGKIEYVDLSFKDKVFYKLKNNTKNDIMSTTTNAKELLD